MAQKGKFDERAVAAMRKEAAERRRGYRERALTLFPHVCASCGREFSGRRLRELTVHHKDHDHENNPPDGSNWELLCLYCHDHEHEKHLMRGHGGSVQNPFRASDGFAVFSELDDLKIDSSGDKPSSGSMG